LRDAFYAKHGTPLACDAAIVQRLQDAAEQAKIELSTLTGVKIHLPFLVNDDSGPRHLQPTLTRTQFEQLSSSLFQETIVECRRALQDANLQPDDIDEVILVGGSSRIPRVRELVKDLFGRPPSKALNPDEVVAIGAAVQAGMLEGEVKAIKLMDVTNFSLGIEVQGRKFARIVEKNATIPLQRTRLVSTVHHNQSVVQIHVLQGEDSRVSNNFSLGQFELNNIQPAPRGIPRILVRFQINEDGMVNVSAKDVRTGICEAITIEAPTGLFQFEIDQMREEAKVVEQKIREDKKKKLISNKVERRVHDLESLIKSHHHQLHQQQLFEIEQAIQRGRMTLSRSEGELRMKYTLAYLTRFYTYVQNRLNR